MSEERFRELWAKVEHIGKIEHLSDDALLALGGIFGELKSKINEQAERVQELEEENERLCALNIATTHELNHVDKINKRYRSILENVELTAQYKGYDDIYNLLVEELVDEE